MELLLLLLLLLLLPSRAQCVPTNLLMWEASITNIPAIQGST
jgi:hypothetical protein